MSMYGRIYLFQLLSLCPGDDLSSRLKELICLTISSQMTSADASRDRHPRRSDRRAGSSAREFIVIKTIRAMSDWSEHTGTALNEVNKRLLTGIGLIAVICLGVFGGAVTFLVLCFAIAWLGLVEFYRLFGMSESRFRLFLAFLLTVCLFGSTFLFTNKTADVRILLINLPVISCIFMSVLLMRSGRPFHDIAILFLGQLYVTIPLIVLYLCSLLPHSGYDPASVLAYFFFLWANDTGAYVFGKLFGRHSLAAAISPGKTWEGSAGGSLAVVALAYINYTLFGEMSMMEWLAFGFIVIVTGTLGDLVKSVMKRSLHVKDCGNILPGHGGILDRFDSLMGSVSFVLLFLMWIV